MLLTRSAKYGSDRKVSFTSENVTYTVSKVRVRSQRKFRQKERRSSSEQSPQAFAKKHGPQKNKKQKNVTYRVSEARERSTKS